MKANRPSIYRLDAFGLSIAQLSSLGGLKIRLHPRFAIQMEGQTTGLQDYEDRIVMVKARSSEDAENKLQPEFKQYGTPYLNPHGFMARWAFERVLDVYEIWDEEIDPRGVEVFSVLAQRRMKPEHAWKTKGKVQAK
jgi:hypothetical protein